MSRESETGQRSAGRPNGKRRRRWPWVLGAAVVLVLGGVIFPRGGAGSKAIDSALLAKVKRGELEIVVLETGKVQPREKVEIKSKVPGQVEKVFVDEGQRVKKSQLLLRLDPTDYRREVAKTEADVAQAKNALEYAQLNLERRKRGLEGRGSSQADVDLAVNEVKSKAVAVRTADVAYNAASDRLRYTQITSPMDGTVIQRGIEPGEVVTPGVQATFEGKALLTVADLSTLIVKVDLNQIDVAKVKLGQSATVTFDALPGRTYDAKVTKVAPASTTPKGKDVDVFPVEATLAKTDGLIKPGMTADVRIHVENKAQALTLPIEAVTKEAGKNYATKVVRSEKKPKLERVEISLGSRNDREVQVLSGLSEGDEVMIKPASAAENEMKM